MRRISSRREKRLVTWTLRLYDDSGTEIAWIQVLSAGTYTYEIVHPESGWRNTEVLLQGSQTVYADGDEPPDVTYEEVTIEREPARIEGTLTPKGIWSAFVTNSARARTSIRRR